MHDDYLEIRRDKSSLKRPFMWSIVFVLADVSIFWVTFLSFGELVNPAPILIAYGLATVAGFLVVTPGGSGAYEGLMVAFLTLSGLSQGGALAGVLLARVIILVFILVIGYGFYHAAITKYGKPEVIDE